MKTIRQSAENVNNYMLPKILVHFVYLSPDENDIPSKEFDGVCDSVPRIGEMVVPQAGSERVIVHAVYNKFIPKPEMGTDFYQYITVVLKECDSQ